MSLTFAQELPYAKLDQLMMCLDHVEGPLPSTDDAIAMLDELITDLDISDYPDPHWHYRRADEKCPTLSVRILAVDGYWWAEWIEDHWTVRSVKGAEIHYVGRSVAAP